jgi:hypothetical protein
MHTHNVRNLNQYKSNAMRNITVVPALKPAEPSYFWGKLVAHVREHLGDNTWLHDGSDSFHHHFVVVPGLVRALPSTERVWSRARRRTEIMR